MTAARPGARLVVVRLRGRGRVVAGGEAGGTLALPGCCLALPGAATSSQPRPSSILRPGHWHGHTALQPHSAMVYSLTQNKATCFYAKLEDGCRCELRIFRIFWTSSNDGLVPYSVFTFQWIMWIKQHNRCRAG